MCSGCGISTLGFFLFSLINAVFGRVRLFFVAFVDLLVLRNVKLMVEKGRKVQGVGRGVSDVGRCMKVRGNSILWYCSRVFCE